MGPVAGRQRFEMTSPICARPSETPKLKDASHDAIHPRATDRNRRSSRLRHQRQREPLMLSTLPIRCSFASRATASTAVTINGASARTTMARSLCCSVATNSTSLLPRPLQGVL